MHFIPIQDLFKQKYAGNKKERNFLRQVLQIAAFQQSFSQCWWKRPILKGSLIQKTYLNHELGSNFFFFLSDLAYKFVNLMVFEKNSSKMSKN